MEEMGECVYCHSRYVNYMNYCLMCGKTQPKQKTTSTVTLQTGHRLTKEKRNKLIRDIQRGLKADELNVQELVGKYGVDRKTITYWKKKLEEKVEKK